MLWMPGCAVLLKAMSAWFLVQSSQVELSIFEGSCWRVFSVFNPASFSLTICPGSSTPHYVKRSLCLLSGLETHEVLCRWEDIQSQVAAARRKYPQDQDRLVLKVTIDEEELSVQPLRHYLFLFNGLSENEVVDRLSSWPDPRGDLKRSFFCSVIAINDRYLSKQILFSPRTALDMETVPTLMRNEQCA